MSRISWLHVSLVAAAFAWSEPLSTPVDTSAAIPGDVASPPEGFDSALPPPADIVASPASVPQDVPRQDSASGSAAKVESARRARTVAVLAFTGDGIAAKDLAAITSRFETELLATDSFKVVERRNIERILSEQGFQQSGACDNSECSVQIGQLLSVEAIFTGEVAKVGKTWSLSVKRTDVGSGQTLFSHVLDIQGSLEDVLRGGCAEMSQIASGRKKPADERSILVARRGSIWPWVAGGAAVAGGIAVVAVLLSKDESSSAPGPSGEQTESDKLVVSW